MVLPYRAHGMLSFPLCKTCADTQTDSCDCSDEERSFIGTWCTPEILEALNQGYEILKIYEVYHLGRHPQNPTNLTIID